MASVTTPDGFEQVRRAYAAMIGGGADQPAGLVLATLGGSGVGLTVLAESTPAAALDRLADIAPLTAVLLAGLWLLFKAYRALVERLMLVIEANTKAHTESSAASRETLEQLKEIRHEMNQGRPRP